MSEVTVSDRTLRPYLFETDSEYFAELCRLVAANLVRIETNPKTLNAHGSPVSRESETMPWAMTAILACAVVWWFWAWWAGLGAGGLILLGFQIFGKKRIARNISRRVRDQGLANLTAWRKLWNYGGIVLTSDAVPMERCEAPAGSWVMFVDQLLRRMAGAKPGAVREG